MKDIESSLPTLKKGAYLVDTHCHLDMETYRDDLDSVIARAVSHNVRGIVTIGIDLASSRAGVKLAEKYMCVKSSVGIHPHDAGSARSSDIENLALLAEENTGIVVGFGEIGLDYVKTFSSPDIQRTMFRKQLATAKDLGLPVIIHDREAHDDCLKIIRETGPFDNGGVMHCFSGDLNFAKKIIDLNLHISIPGIVTFKNARNIQEAATHIPLDMMLVETDGPFLAPVPYRGKRNEPSFTLFTAAAVANLKNITIEEVAEHTSQNACTLFRTSFHDKQ